MSASIAHPVHAEFLATAQLGVLMHSVTKPGTHDFRRELTGEDSLKSWLKQSQQALKEVALAGVTEGGTSHQSGNYRLKSLPSGD